MITLSDSSATTAGILLLSIVGIEYGGVFMLRIVGGRVPLTEFQQRFFRAGHAHAGVLVTLSLVGVVLVDATDLTGAWQAIARGGIPFAAIAMSAGFFFAAIGRERTTPNRWIYLLFAGAGGLALGAVALGIGLLTA